MEDKLGRRERTGRTGEPHAGMMKRDIGASLDKLKQVETHWQRAKDGKPGVSSIRSIIKVE